MSAASADQAQLSVYAAQRSSDNTLTLIVINKTGGALTSSVSLAGFTSSGAAKVYRYSAANLNAIVKDADQAVTATGFSATFPANSITLFVMASSGGTPLPSATPSPSPTPNLYVTPRAFLPISRK